MGEKSHNAAPFILSYTGWILISGSIYFIFDCILISCFSFNDLIISHYKNNILVYLYFSLIILKYNIKMI